MDTSTRNENGEKNMRIRFVIGSLIALVAVAPSRGETPLGTAFTYQGQLKQSGAPLDGTADFQFTLWDAAGSGNPPTGGIQVGGVQAINALPVTSGLFTTVALNGAGEFGANAFIGNARWVQVAVRSPAGGGLFTTLAPRQPLTATPHALFALNADRLDSVDSAAFLQSVPNPLTLSGTSGTHIIRGENASPIGGAAGVYGLATGITNLGTYGVQGRSDSSSGYGVFGEAPAATGVTYGGRFESASTAGRGVLGWATAGTGTTYGVVGQTASTDGRGVLGLSTSASGTNYGVYGQSNSRGGRGVYGSATSTSDGASYGGFFESASSSGHGVLGLATAASGTTYGGRFASSSTSGTGVSGLATASSGSTYGVVGRSDSPDGRGVYGMAAATSGATYGGFFESTSSSGHGVYGFASALTGFTRGVHGVVDSSGGRAVWGEATAVTGVTYGVYGQSASENGTGVLGWASHATGTIYGVRGQASGLGGGYAVYAQGDMGASGTKPFRIDHPDDPANKYLLHYAAESPEVINFYRGTVVLDGAGQAVVELPHYFAKINKTPSYQLTAVGAPMPLLHVAVEIDEAALSAGATAGAGVAAPLCSFRIAGGAPGAKVSWRVEALRNDLWVRNRAMALEGLHDDLAIQTRAMPVEVEKQGREKGTYQHPELYGLPAEMGMNYDATRAERGLHDRPDSERPASPDTLGKALTP